MKGHHFLVFLSAVIMMSACNKIGNTVNNVPKPNNYATMGGASSKEGGKPIEITITVGHDISECNNSCVLVNGEPGHVDCQGFGEACVVTIRIWPIGGQPKGGTFCAIVDTVWGLTSEDFFDMPNRSLTILNAPSEDEAYLNIPAQLVFRDSVTQQFTFTGLFITEEPEYTND